MRRRRSFLRALASGQKRGVPLRAHRRPGRQSVGAQAQAAQAAVQRAQRGGQRAQAVEAEVERAEAAQVVQVAVLERLQLVEGQLQHAQAVQVAHLGREPAGVVLRCTPGHV